MPGVVLNSRGDAAKTVWHQVCTLFTYPRSVSFLFAIFLFAGVLKELPLLGWLPVDLTLVALVASIVAVVVVVVLRGVDWSDGISRGLLLMALLVGWSLVSLIWSAGREYAGDKALYFGLLGTWSFVGGIVVGNSEVRTLRFGRSIVFLGVWLSAEVLLMFSGGAVLATADWGESYIGFGRLIGYGVLVLISRLLARGAGGWRGIGSIVLLGVLGTGILMGGARGPLLGTITGLGIVASAGASGSLLRIKINRRLLILGSALILVPGIAVVATRSGMFLRTIERLLVLASASDSHSFGRRLWYWQEAWDRWLDSPFVGHGLGSWPLMIGWGDVRAYPHNIVLEIGVELGIVGIILFLLLLANAMPMTKQRLGPGSVPVLISALTVAALVNSLISGDLVDNRVAFAFLGMATGIAGRVVK